MSNDAYIPDDDNESGIDLEECQLWELEKEYKAHKADLQKQFNDYLYNNYTIGNGEQLINILEQGDALADFLDLMGLPEDTEIDL